MSDIEQFQRSMEKELNHFLNPEEAKRKKPTASPPPKGLQVQLIVRDSKLSPDVLFLHDSDKISHLEAKIEANRAAKEAGWKIIGRLHDIVPL